MFFPATTANRELADRIFLTELDECLLFPKYFQIETVNACNSRCIFCGVNEWDRTRDLTMSMALFAKFVEEVGHYSDWVEQVCLNLGGEPTLDRQLPQRVRMLKEVGIKKTDISTNGQLLTPQFATELIQAGIDEIWVSINAITKPTYEKIQKGLNFDDVMNNAAELFRLRKELKPDLAIRIRMLVLEENKHEVNDWISYWRGLANDKDRIYAKYPHSFGNQLWENTASDVEFFADKPCVSPFSTMVMQTNGKVGLCVADYNGLLTMGDFPRQTVKEIWTGEQFQHVRRHHANANRNEVKLCRGCNIWERDAIERGI